MADTPTPDLKELETAVTLQKEGKALTVEQVKLLKSYGVYLEKHSKYYEQQVEHIKRYIDLLKERTDKELDYSEILAQNNELKEAEIAIEQAKIREANEYIDKYDALLVSQQEKLDKLAEEEKELKKIKDLLDKQSESLHDIRKLTKLKEKHNIKDLDDAQELLKAKTNEKNLQKRALKEMPNILKAKEEELKLAHEQNDLLVDRRNINAGLETGIKGIFKTFLGLQDQSKSFLGSLIKSFQQTGSWDKSLEKVQESWKALVNPLNMVYAAIGAIALSTLAWMKEFDSASADFRKSTGIMEEGLGGIEAQTNRVQRANLRYGVSTKEAFAATQSLAVEMRQFRKMGEKNRQELMDITSIMGELGASTQTTARIFNTFQKGLGYNAKQLKGLGLELSAISKSLGRPLQEVTDDFNASMPELMKYGEGMRDVFAGLAEQSVETGIAMQELLGIAKQFDTFEEAGNAVGRLNAVLGGPYLNAIEMVYATEAERIQAMRDALKLHPQQFKNMSRHEKQAIAAAAGIKDMAEAEMLFGSTDAEYAQRGMEMKEMQQRAQDAQAVQEKLAQAMQSLAVAAVPVVEVLADLADAILLVLQPFTYWADESPRLVEFLNYLPTALLGVILALKLFGMESMKAFAPWLAFIGVFVLVKGALEWLQGFGKGGTIASVFFAIAAAIWAVVLAKAALALPVGPIKLGIAVGMGLAAISAGVAGIKKLAEFAVGVDDFTGGPALVGEKGAELITTKGGGTYMAAGPQVVDLPQGSNVITNKNTKDIMSGRTGAKGGAAGHVGGGIPPELIISLRQLQGSIDILNQNILADQTKTPERDERQVIIEMDGKKVADTVISRINKKSRLSISKA